MKPEEYGLEVTVEIITPEMAESYLGNNFKHRPIKDNKVAKYVSEMNDNDWKFNGKTIVFDNQGMLLNGQHRLSAVIASGKSLTTLVVRGISPDQIVKE